MASRLRHCVAQRHQQGGEVSDNSLHYAPASYKHGSDIHLCSETRIQAVPAVAASAASHGRRCSIVGGARHIALNPETGRLKVHDNNTPPVATLPESRES